MRGGAVGRVVVIGLLAAGCELFLPTPAPPTIPPGAEVDCGPLLDQGLCRTAIQTALVAQLNPPPIVRASLRRPNVNDDCFADFVGCDASTVIVTLQSGDTVQDVALKRTDSGWVRLERVP